MNHVSLILLTSISLSSFAGDYGKTVSTLRSSTSKCIILACKVALAPYSMLEYISTLAHEHGHGLASGENYMIRIDRQDNLFHPWIGVSYLNTPYTFFNTFTGPLGGISATYVQCICLNTAKEYLNKKSLSTSFYKGVQFPISFFPNMIKTGITHGSLLANPQLINFSLSANTLISIPIDILLFSRMGRIIAESMYGFLPYNCRYYDNPSDGERLWKMLFGENCPTFKCNLVQITFTLLFLPYIIGIILAFAQP